MPKTAICLSGELRSIDKTFPLIEKNILSRFSDYDIFYFTWTDDPDLDKLRVLIKTGRVKDLDLKARMSFNEDEYFPKKPLKTNYQNIIRQLYCLKQVNDLKSQYEDENNFKYDIVVRIRPDLLLLNDSSLPENFEQSDFNYLHLLNHDNWHGYCDRFYVSNSPNMDILSNRINDVRYYSESGGSQQYEAFLKFISVWHDIDIKRINTLKTCLLRTNGVTEGEIVAVERGEIEIRPDGIYHLLDENYI
jgi:hypothetical protein